MNIPLGSISHNRFFLHIEHKFILISSFSCFTVSSRFFLSVSFPLSYWYFSIYFNRISISFRFLYLYILYFHLFLLWEVCPLFYLLSYPLVSLCLCSSLQCVEDYGIRAGKVRCPRLHLALPCIGDILTFSRIHFSFLPLKVEKFLILNEYFVLNPHS